MGVRPGELQRPTNLGVVPEASSDHHLFLLRLWSLGSVLGTSKNVDDKAAVRSAAFRADFSDDIRAEIFLRVESVSRLAKAEWIADAAAAGHPIPNHIV